MEIEENKKKLFEQKKKNTMSTELQILERVKQFCDEMSSTNKTNEKKLILKKYPDLKKLIMVVYDPFEKFNVSSNNIKKRAKSLNSKKRNLTDTKTTVIPDDIFSLLDLLSKRKITGNQALDTCHEYVSKFEKKYQEILWKILDKDLKVGVQPKTINDIFPNLVPQFDVVLADKYDKYSHSINFSSEEWYSSRKLDGCRCLVMIKENDIGFFSRTGNEFTSLSLLKPYFEHLGLSNVVFDGELCIIDDGGNENFTQCVSEIRKKNHTIEKPVFFAFDVVGLDEFVRGYSETLFAERQNKLSEYLGGIERRDSYPIKILKQEKITDEDHLSNMMKDACDGGWEGLIIRKNINYEAKRSRNVLKMKKFEDDEFIVNDTINGKMQIFEDGVKKEIETLSAVVIEYKGNVVKVGSGFSVEERRKIYDDPGSIIGKEITVQYFEESKNKNGGVSMRFPTVKKIWWQKRDL